MNPPTIPDLNYSSEAPVVSTISQEALLIAGRRHHTIVERHQGF
jgi:hypothetical protein